MADRAATKKKKKPALNIGGTSNRLRGGVARQNKRWKEGRPHVQTAFFLDEWSGAAAAAAAATTA